MAGSMRKETQEEIIWGQQSTSALGLHAMWGFSPARRKRGDAAKKGARPLHFYVYEPVLEVLARHLLLLQLVHDFELPVRARATTFLEVYGNALVQQRTDRYVARLGRALVALVAGDAGARGAPPGADALAGLVDLALLKFRER